MWECLSETDIKQRVAIMAKRKIIYCWTPALKPSEASVDFGQCLVCSKSLKYYVDESALMVNRR